MAQALIYGEPLPPGSDAFTRFRRSGIGGSDTGPLLGLSGYRSRLGLWQVKRGLIADTQSTERMLWGQRLEGAIRHGYVADYGIPVVKPSRARHKAWPTGGRFRHPTLPFVIGHPDGLTPPGYAEQVLLEVKTTAFQRDDWGPDDTDQVPASYYSQVQHYLLLTGYPVCHLVVLVGGNAMHRYIIEANGAFQMALVEEERLLWEDVKSGTPPAPDGSADAGRALRRMYPVAVPETIEATPELDFQARLFIDARSAESASKKAKDAAGQSMQDYMKAAERMVGAGYIATWGNTNGKVDWEAVARSLSTHEEKELAAYADAYRKPGRTFRVNAAKEGANGA